MQLASLKILLVLKLILFSPIHNLAQKKMLGMIVDEIPHASFVFLQMFKVWGFGEVEGLCGLCLFVAVGLYVRGISCNVQMGRVLTFFAGGSSCFCRIAATIDEDRKMVLQSVVALVYKGVWVVIHSY